MNKLYKTVATIVISGLLIYVSMGLFKFFDIGVGVYGNYLLWGVALVIFSIVLPEKVENIFSKDF
jgi:hypothetical protein